MNYNWLLKDTIFTKDKGKVFTCFSGGGGSSLGYQLPVLAELYLGDIDDKNFHFGLGFSYGAAAYAGDGGVVLGPIVGIGGQFELQDKLIGVRGTYTLGLNKSEGFEAGNGFSESRSMIGLGIYYLLGQ